MEELIIRVLQTRATAGEDAKVRAWRSQSPANDAHFRDLASIWTNLRDIEVETIPPDAASIRQRAEQSPVIPIRRARASRGPWWIPVIAIAATLAAVVVGGDLFQRQLLESGPVLQIEQLATGESETLMTELSDGTIVYLAPNSRLQVSPTPGVREVWLEGKAFFGVTRHGEDWPFLVRSERGTVRVLGTRFEVSTDGADTRVMVVEGKIDFASSEDPGSERIEVSAGQMSIASSDASLQLVENVDVDAYLGWMGSVLVFENTPLSQVIREIEARFDGVIELQSETLGEQTITGGFKDRTFGEVVSTICRVVAADCEIDGVRAVITSRAVFDMMPAVASNPPNQRS